MILPRRNLSRSIGYYKKRVLRIGASPHAVSAGFAAGVAASLTPFIGLHFLLSFVIAFFVRGNMLAAALGTAVGNPITFPFIWATTFNFGAWLTGNSDAEFASSSLVNGVDVMALDEGAIAAMWPVLQPMLIGCVPIALGIGVLTYFSLRHSIRQYRVKRMARLAAKRAEFAKSHAVPTAPLS